MFHDLLHLSEVACACKGEEPGITEDNIDLMEQHLLGAIVIFGVFMRLVKSNEFKLGKKRLTKLGSIDTCITHSYEIYELYCNDMGRVLH